MEVGKLFVSIFADDSEFRQGMDGVQDKMKTVGGNLSKTGGTLTKNVTAPIMAVGGAALGMANKYAGMGDDIAKTSTKLGIGTDALQEMQYWASQNGIEASAMERGVGRLNQRVGRAATGNEKYAGAFEDLGISIHDANGNIRDTESVMQDTVAALREIEDPATRSAMASEIFGTKMARDLMPALEDSSLSLEDAKEKIHEMGGVMSEDAVRSAEKYEDAMDDLKREFGGVFMEIGTKLIPIITDSLLPAIQDHIIPAVRNFVEWIGNLIEWFQDLNPTVQKVIGFIVGLAVALGPILIVVGKVISIFAVLVPIFKAVGAAILFLTSPIGLIIAAIAALIAIGVLIWKNWDTIKEKAAQIWGAIKDFFANLWESIKETAIGAWDAIKDFFSGLWDSIKEIFSNALAAIVDFFMTYHPLGIIISNWEEIKQFFSNVWESIKDIFSNALNAVVDHVKNEFNRTKDLVTGIWDSIKTFILDIWDKLKSGVADKASALKDSVITIIDSAMQWIRELPGKALQWGKDVIQGLINGIRNMAGNLGGAIRGVVDNAVSGVRNFLGLSSPSKLFREMGVNVGEGFEQGIERMKGAVAGSMRDMVQPPRLATATASPAAPGAGVSSGSGSITNHFNIEQMNVRDDKDVEKIARELYKLQGRRDRGVS